MAICKLASYISSNKVVQAKQITFFYASDYSKISQFIIAMNQSRTYRKRSIVKIVVEFIFSVDSERSIIRRVSIDLPGTVPV